MPPLNQRYECAYGIHRGLTCLSKPDFYRDFQEIPKQINPTGLPIDALRVIFLRVRFLSQTQRKIRNALEIRHEPDQNCPNYSNYRLLDFHGREKISTRKANFGSKGRIERSALQRMEGYCGIVFYRNR